MTASQDDQFFRTFGTVCATVAVLFLVTCPVLFVTLAIDASYASATPPTLVISPDTPHQHTPTTGRTPLSRSPASRRWRTKR